MFIYDTMNQGLELLARRELQEAENLFLSVVNDPYSQPEETKQAKQYLNDIRDCKKGDKTLNFDNYKDLVKNIVASLDYVDEYSRYYYDDCALDHRLGIKRPVPGFGKARRRVPGFISGNLSKTVTSEKP
jgi:hypothetical protein